MSRQPAVEWKVAGGCNYACSYCIQSPRHRRGGMDRAHLEAAVDQLAALPGVWELKLSGGEAFAHPLFLDSLVPALVARTGHRLSVLTNLSAPRRDLARFARLTRGRLAVLSASLHLEAVSLDAFATQAAWLADQLEPSVRLVVNQVVLPGRLDEAATCRRTLEGAGLRWFPQLLKVDGRVAAYPDKAALSRLVGDLDGPGQVNAAPSYRGRRCWAGVEYFAVEPDGSAWSCRSARRVGEGHLGNLYDGTLRLRDAPRPCPYSTCPCTVPANRGLIESTRARPSTPPRPRRPRPSPAPPYPLEGVASWNMGTACNYDCSYCTQRQVDDRAALAADLPAFVEGFASLPGDWEVKLSGGEPFVHPGLDEAVEALAARGVRVSVVTNLSATPERLRRFARATRARPGLLSASLHLERADPDAFIDKLAAFSRAFAGRTHATVVATRPVLPLLEGLVARFAAAGLALKVQPEKADRDVIAYTAEERALLSRLGGHNGTGYLAPDLGGRMCWAGSRYLVVDHRGEAWPCYPARRYRRGALGNLARGELTLAPGPAPCPFSYCNCTVPQQRGMVSMLPPPPDSGGPPCPSPET